MTYFLYFGICYKQVCIRFHLSCIPCISGDFYDFTIFITDSREKTSGTSSLHHHEHICDGISLSMSLRIVIFVIWLWIGHKIHYIIVNLNIFKRVIITEFHCNVTSIHTSSYDLQYITQTSFNYEASKTKWVSSTSLHIWIRLTQR